MGREQAFKAGLASLFSSEQAPNLDANNTGGTARSQAGPAEYAGAKGKVAMKDSQAEPVDDSVVKEPITTEANQAATDEPAAIAESQIEYGEDTAEETHAAAEDSQVVPAEGSDVEADLPDVVPGPEPESVSADGLTAHLVVFALGDEEYAVDIDAVDSIMRLQPVTAVPRAPDFVEGLTNLRGTVLPVVDLHKRFGLSTGDTTRNARIIVAESNGSKIGMRVDAVLEVRRVPQGAIEPPSPLVATVDSAFVTGVAKVAEDRLVILLDLARVLAHD